ncbi:MAG TPA: PBP1A family penicillin-binding protein [Candidatus Paceibacterota bacterium]|nr:PBP1A family penicillin-binding protein [Candidatus Paceibacterota bacterium]
MNALRHPWRALKRLFHKIPEWLRLSVVALLALIFFGLGGVIVWASVVPIPSITNFEDRKVAESTKIYDRTGNVLLYDVHGNEQRTSIPLDQISPDIQHATISIEDDTFYSNPGINPLSIVRSLLADLTSGGYAQGGSTITQQVVKNALLTQNKTLTRKIEEIILALRLTRAYSKDQILDTYLNEAPYGGTIYGVEEAAQNFFGVDASQVDLAQAAYIAALPQAPTYYSPYGNNRSALDDRKNLVLSKMLSLGYITKTQYDQAVAEHVQFKAISNAGIKAPHFVFYIQQYLEQKYGVDAVENGGLRVVTTLDYDLQQHAEASVKKYADQMQQNFNASNEGIVAIDPTSGQILAMVGSRDYFNNAIDGQVNVTLANRQPGSSFKPFVYATAFEKGYTPDTVLFDLPTQFSTACSPQDNTNSNSPCYSPGNYDGQFHGPLSMRDAIAISDNVVSVKVLYLAGIQNSITTAQSMGISTLGDPSRYGLTLVLGGGEVNLLDETGAYAVFANDGVKNPPTGILQVTDSSGNVLEQYSPQPTRVLDPQIARLINNILSDDTARSPEFGVHGVLWFPEANVADKTGTTNDFRDTWVLGYTPGIAVGAWAGNNDNTPMEKKIAAFIIAPMWHDFMEYAIQKYPAADFPPPAPETGNLPPVLTGNWNTDPSKGVHDILYWVQKDNPLAGPPANPWADPQTAYWDYPVQAWAAQQGYQAGGGGSVPEISPTTTTPPTQTTASGLQFTSPKSNSPVPANTPLQISADDPNQVVETVVYYLNGVDIGMSSTPPFTISIMPAFHGSAQMRAVAQLVNGTVEEKSMTITVQ